MVLRALLNGGKDAPVIVGEVTEGVSIELHCGVAVVVVTLN
jgi:hypothetical protein